MSFYLFVLRVFIFLRFSEDYVFEHYRPHPNGDKLKRVSGVKLYWIISQHCEELVELFSQSRKILDKRYWTRVNFYVVLNWSNSGDKRITHTSSMKPLFHTSLKRTKGLVSWTIIRECWTWKFDEWYLWFSNWSFYTWIFHQNKVWLCKFLFFEFSCFEVKSEV